MPMSCTTIACLSVFLPILWSLTTVPGQNKFSLIVVKQFLSVSVYCADELLTFYRWSKPLYSWPRMWPWQMHALVVSGVSVVPAVPGWPLFFIKAHSKWDYLWWTFFESFWLVDEINYFPMIPGHFAYIASLKYLLSFIAGLWLSWPSPSFLLCICRTRVSILFQVVQKTLRTLACIIVCISHGFWVPVLSHRDRMYCFLQVLIPSRDLFPSFCLPALSSVLVLFLRAHLPMMAPCDSANTSDLSDY